MLGQVLAADINIGYEDMVNTRVSGVQNTTYSVSFCTYLKTIGKTICKERSVLVTEESLVLTLRFNVKIY